MPHCITHLRAKPSRARIFPQANCCFWREGCLLRSDLLRPCSDPLPTVAEHRPIPTLVGFNKVELGSDYETNRVGVGLPKSPLRRCGELVVRPCSDLPCRSSLAVHAGMHAFGDSWFADQAFILIYSDRFRSVLICSALFCSILIDLFSLHVLP